MYTIATALFLSLVSASPIAPRAAPTYKFNGDAPFTVGTETLAAALTCPRGNPTAAKPPVLLVHGTATTGAQSWEKGFVPALALNGYTPCYVTLPARAMDDMQISSEYVAYNLHYLSALSGGLKPAIISHSQGGPVSQWALQFWPSTRSVARAFIPLAPDFDGVDLAISDLSAICDLIDCQPSLWQQSEGSNYYKALHAGAFRALVPTTSIWSKVRPSTPAFDQRTLLTSDTRPTAWSLPLKRTQTCPAQKSSQSDSSVHFVPSTTYTSLLTRPLSL